MRMSRLLVRTLRHDPADAASDAERLLVRAGYVQRAGPRSLAWMPLGRMLHARVAGIVSDELRAAGFQEVALPEAPSRPAAGDGAVAGPADPAASTAAMLFGAVESYRRCPARAFAIGPWPGGTGTGARGLLRTDRPLTVRAFGADMDSARQAETLAAIADAFDRAAARLGLEPLQAAWPSVGAPEGRAWGAARAAADVDVLRCPSCGLAAHPDAVPLDRPRPAAEDPRPVQEVETPGTTTIAALGGYLGLPIDRLAKAAFFSTGDDRLVTAIVRGDHEVSEAKLAGVVGAAELRPALPERIRASGMEPGYGSPVGAHDTTVVLDVVASRAPNLVGGANRPGYHLLNLNAGRDFVPDAVADIARATDGDACPRCGASLGRMSVEPLAVAGALAAQSGPDAAVFRAEDGTTRPLVLTAAAFDLDQAAGCAAEAHRDDRGLAWPPAVAPFGAHLVALGAGRDPAIEAAASTLDDAARSGAGDLLYDDRGESPGISFADADLLGMPVRLTVSSRSLAAGGVEVVGRRSGARRVLPLDDVVGLIGRGRDALADAAERPA